ncbi:RagB/SusD family nutrient uptake outer membrane protein [Cellulophaga tyrosinoxydans]|uniref:Starch-binding associating with outer membrane n=1 Tax=Cellulophaga tyrosinoxydans TaxID=504486 RepID=A0A1W2C4L0_9FLAO|nr:RagB/SusD family nutrient uptake outer membrane protein [Cellulophaga tyrosinoxydans]SMC79658.1 Starch-binding associating with outer membrane [Cellulophaga tyrosinoxydans]
MKIYKLQGAAVLFATLGMFFSCDDKLDVQGESFVTPETFYSNQAELDIALAGVYDGLQTVYDNANYVFGEFRSDSYFPAPASTNVSRTSFHDSNMDAADGSLRWNNFYTTIDRANRVIIAGEALEGIDPNSLGQAYAIRSKVYFDLIRIWNNVPLFLVPITSPSDAYRPVTSYSEIMNTVVIPDMLKAESLISASPSPFRFSLPSVLAHQAEVYMWQKTQADNILAESAIERLLGLNSYSLTTSPQAWQDMFYNQPPTNTLPDALGKIQTGPELIFSIRYDDADTTPSGLWSSWVAGSSITVISPLVEEKWIERFPQDETWNDLYPTTPPVLSITTVDQNGAPVEEPLYGDWRQFASRERGDFETGMGPAVIGEARLHKWTKNRDGMVVNLDRSDVVMYRLADMILLLAEAKIKLNKPEEALTLINQIRSARKLPLATDVAFGTTVDEQINYLLDERQFELLGEGKRWWDLIRNDKALEFVNPLLASRGQNPLTADRLFYPIFQNHIIESLGAYQQNPGW